MESDRPAFFEEPWEIVLLPGSDKCLATSCAGFIRTTGEARKEGLDLNLDSDNKLRILMVTPRPHDISDIHFHSTRMDIFNHLLGYETAFDIDVLTQPTWQALQEKLSSKGQQYHLLEPV